LKLNENDINIYLDNAKIHRSAETVNYLNENNINYLFGPPYSPSIEMAFNVIKCYLRNIDENDIDIIFAFNNACSKITQSHALSFIKKVIERFNEFEEL
jgi:hypothetical protein